jgi:hypothetical protein
MEEGLRPQETLGISTQLYDQLFEGFLVIIDVLFS